MKLKDIAALAGVSATTASYVLNGKGDALRISPATIKRVLELAEAHGYRANVQAVALRLRQTRSLGFILPDLENPSYARIAKLLERIARNRGYQMLIACTDDDAVNERALIEMMRPRCDGVIVASCLAENDAPYRRARAEGWPIVAVDRQLDPETFISVVSDDETACFDLTAALLDGGTTSAALIGARHELTISRARESGFVRATEQAHVQSHIHHGGTFSRDSGRDHMQTLLKTTRGKLPDVIITMSYVLLTGVLDVLRVHGGNWHEQVRLGTFGHAQLLDFLPAPVRPMAQQHEMIAERAMDYLLNAIEHREYQPKVDAVPRRNMG